VCEMQWMWNLKGNSNHIQSDIEVVNTYLEIEGDIQKYNIVTAPISQICQEKK